MQLECQLNVNKSVKYFNGPIIVIFIFTSYDVFLILLLEWFLKNLKNGLNTPMNNLLEYYNRRIKNLNRLLLFIQV